jgi:hypothetical protein
MARFVHESGQTTETIEFGFSLMISTTHRTSPSNNSSSVPMGGHGQGLGLAHNPANYGLRAGGLRGLSSPGQRRIRVSVRD